MAGPRSNPPCLLFVCYCCIVYCCTVSIILPPLFSLSPPCIMHQNASPWVVVSYVSHLVHIITFHNHCYIHHITRHEYRYIQRLLLHCLFFLNQNPLPAHPLINSTSPLMEASMSWVVLVGFHPMDLERSPRAREFDPRYSACIIGQPKGDTIEEETDDIPRQCISAILPC